MIAPGVQSSQHDIANRNSFQSEISPILSGQDSQQDIKQRKWPKNLILSIDITPSSPKTERIAPPGRGRVRFQYYHGIERGRN